MYAIKTTKGFRLRFLEIIENQSYNTISIADKTDIMLNHISVFPYMFAEIARVNGKSIRKAFIKPFNIFYTVDEIKKKIIIIKISYYREYYKF